ncbi:DUF6214 family protein [Streptomyces sp. NPDC052101]|uniref:DUF6214 family protein n=1 Tax=Streptomyces sp. NPDC052101 TaxID=3155763 RepID=UPI00341FB12F
MVCGRLQHGTPGPTTAGAGGVTATRVRSYGMRSCGYVACVLEASLLNLSDRNTEDGAVSVWPAWKVREHGGTTSWFQVQLAFPDGARVDALAVLHAGCVSIEDVSAQPALSLADLTALAHWLEGPLFESCGVAAEPPHEAARDECPEERHESECLRGPHEGEPPVMRHVSEQPEERYACTRPEVAHAGEPPEGLREVHPLEGLRGVEAPEEPREGGRPQRRPEPESGGAQVIVLGAGPRRARAGWPRGVEGRRLVAREYRAAQQGGVDPVLAVMSATGRSRRRSLRLIAQARDAGFLTPRHARRR